MVLTGDMSANPVPDISCHIEVACIRVWLVLIDRRRPVNGDAAQNESKKERHVQPVTPAHEDLVTFNHEHAWLYQYRARGSRLVMKGWHRAHSLKPDTHLLLRRIRWNELKDLVRLNCSVRELLGCRVDDVARTERDLLRRD